MDASAFCAKSFKLSSLRRQGPKFCHVWNCVSFATTDAAGAFGKQATPSHFLLFRQTKEKTTRAVGNIGRPSGVPYAAHDLGPLTKIEIVVEAR
ncbi:hypothetical protein AEM42_14375 [Betaproteobacteria bacterium UKL13-2]|nr:hypothetical protein AEM42_14375 [Betaproteobacteria bacterium UKL13-2]HCG53172.1 hypothetical protein [Betaproteobacteria bacterium]